MMRTKTPFSVLRLGLFLGLLAVGAQPVAAQTPSAPDACAAVFAGSPSPPFLHVQKADLSVEDLLKQGRHQEALWVAQETGQKRLADEIYEMIEKTLLKGAVNSVVRAAGASGGSILTFDNGIKGVFKPSTVRYVKHEVGAYLLDRALKMNLIPVTVYRETADFTGTVQMFVPNAPQRPTYYNPDHGYVAGVDPKRINMLGLFDRLIVNCDRHGWNYLVTKDTRRLVAIDHGHTMWNNYGDRGAGITSVTDDEEFYRRILALTPERIRTILERWVEVPYIEAVLRARTSLIKDLEVGLKLQTPAA